MASMICSRSVALPITPVSKSKSLAFLKMEVVGVLDWVLEFWLASF